MSTIHAIITILALIALPGTMLGACYLGIRMARRP
jgi:hypothetical protein